MSRGMFVAQGKGNTTSSGRASRRNGEQRNAETLLRASVSSFPSIPSNPNHPCQAHSRAPVPLSQHLQCEVLGKEVSIREPTPTLDTTAVSGVTQDNKTTACEQRSASVCLLCCPNKSSPIRFDHSTSKEMNCVVLGELPKPVFP